MLKHLFPVWAPALALAFAVAFLPACQKESILSTTESALTFSTEDRGDDLGGQAEHRRRRHHHDSLGNHPHDSLGHHPHDSLHIGHHGPHHPLDSAHIGHGPHHPHDSIATGCQVRPMKIMVADLPAAAQAWITANAPTAQVASVTKVTRRDCTIEYLVRFRGRQPVTFDANGNKK